MRRAWANKTRRLESRLLGAPNWLPAPFGGRLATLAMGLASLAIAQPQEAQAMSDVHALVRILESQDLSARTTAAEKLAQLGELAQPAAVALVHAVNSEDEDLREWAVGALEGLGPPATDDVPKLTALLNRPEPDVAYWATTLLGRLKGDAAAAVGPLIEALNTHPATTVRERAAWALGQMGPAAAAAKDDLDQAAQSPSPRLAKLAQAALQQL